MESWVEMIACSGGLARKFMEVNEVLAEVWNEVYMTFVNALQIISPSESLTDFKDLIQINSYIGDDVLSPRQYGEMLSWRKCMRPYKAHAYPYIAVFKRNLPYQRRPQ